MAILISSDGSEREVLPLRAKSGFTLRELYALIGCTTVQMIGLADGRTMWMDENGKFADVHFVNEKATALALEAGMMPNDYVVGKVLICTKGEVK